ncbi:MAG: hypothetical protein ACOCT9_01420 [archaeon]
MHIRVKSKNEDRLLHIEGDVGYLTLKLNGDELMKENFWNLFHVGQFMMI